MSTLDWIAIVTAAILISGALGIFLGYRWGRRSAYEEIDEKQMYATIED